MDLFTEAFPYLWHLLGAYFHQDWLLDDDTEEDVVVRFVQTSHAADVWATVADIRRFLLYHPAADAAYARLFPNETGPEPGEGAEAWLRWLERAILIRAPALPAKDDG